LSVSSTLCSPHDPIRRAAAHYLLLPSPSSLSHVVADAAQHQHDSTFFSMRLSHMRLEVPVSIPSAARNPSSLSLSVSVSFVRASHNTQVIGALSLDQTTVMARHSRRSR
jgi:hypothetical protein